MLDHLQLADKQLLSMRIFAQSSPNAQLAEDVRFTFNNSSRFYAGEFAYRMRTDETGLFFSIKFPTTSDSVTEISPKYKTINPAIRWVVNSIASGQHEPDEELAEQFRRSHMVTINGYDFASSFSNDDVPHYSIVCHPSLEESMLRYRTSDIPGYSTRTFKRDLSIVPGYAFSRYQDIVSFLTSSEFRRIGTTILPRNIRWQGNEGNFVPSIIGIVRELSDRSKISTGGLIFTGKSLLEGHLSSSYEDIKEGAVEDDVYLSFRGSSTEENKADELFANLDDIVRRHFPDRRVDIIEDAGLLLGGPVFAIRRMSTLSGRPQAVRARRPTSSHQEDDLETKPSSLPKRIPTVRELFQDIELPQEDDDFGIVFSSVKKKPRTISFDWDDTVMIADRADGKMDFDQYDNPTSGTLNQDAAELMRLYAKQGCNIVVVTCRTPEGLNQIWEAIKEYGLPVNEVYATSHTSKAPILLELGASIHYDDNDFRMDEIRTELGYAISVRHVNQIPKDIEQSITQE